MKQEKLLKHILELELEVGNLNDKLRLKCREYAEKYAKWKINDAVIVRWGDNNGFVCYGKIAHIRFDGHGFKYTVRPTKKNGERNMAHQSYKNIDWNSDIYIIEKYNG